jgi:hypothetical protein
VILIKVGEFVESIDNSILAKFQNIIACSFFGPRDRNHKKVESFDTLSQLKLIITFVLYMLQHSCKACLKANKMLFSERYITHV